MEEEHSEMTQEYQQQQEQQGQQQQQENGSLSQIDKILVELRHELYKEINHTKKEIVKKAAGKLEEIGVIKPAIAGLIIEKIPEISASLVYLALKELGEGYTRDYKSTMTVDIDDKKCQEEISRDAENVRQNYGFDNKQEEDKPSKVHQKIMSRNKKLVEELKVSRELNSQLQNEMIKQRVRVVRLGLKYAKKLTKMIGIDQEIVDKIQEVPNIHLVVDGSDLYTILDHEPSLQEVAEVIPIE